ncbi:FAD-binding oxidoreductase [Micromonospora sp. STR1_7]|uniref:FAD-binding oxidoreductase n=1 Tax=Micromonospora parastrephiae TaxID=2806101 RepID=A0ABS1XU65_9ACTN|nr:FAD-binding oxidoreductase [Micromonospora parastrephiae]MBM0232810.1 FAD-binding oxidoreductase [Micromonospora parastrephiae]
MIDRYLLRLRRDFDGEVLTRDHAAYDPARRPVGSAGAARRPLVVLRCRSVRDVVAAVAFARDTGIALAVRSGGHCFAGRSSTDGVLIDVSGLHGVDLSADGTATVGAGVRLGQLYGALHARGQTLPAGCGATVGIAGLVLGGGIGLLGRRHGPTCDRLVAATIVLADGSVVDCDEHREPDLFWALHGAGGGQLGVVTSLRLATITEPMTARVALTCPDADPARVVASWQASAPDAPDDISTSLELAREPGRPVRATVSGVAVDAARAGGWLHDLAREAGAGAQLFVADPVPFTVAKRALADPCQDVGDGRLRSEYFARPMPAGAVTELIALLGGGDARHRRRLTFTAMGGAYNRVAPEATAFVHRRERYLLEHVGHRSDSWVDASWALAHRHSSHRVYPNFPDPLLDRPAEAYWGTNHARLAAVKRSYDPQHLFGFPQSL